MGGGGGGEENKAISRTPHVHWYVSVRLLVKDKIQVIHLITIHVVRRNKSNFACLMKLRLLFRWYLFQSFFGLQANLEQAEQEEEANKLAEAMKEREKEKEKEKDVGKKGGKDKKQEKKGKKSANKANKQETPPPGTVEKGSRTWGGGGW